MNIQVRERFDRRGRNSGNGKWRLQGAGDFAIGPWMSLLADDNRDSYGSRILSGLLALLMLIGVALSGSPELHAAIHPDSHDQEHTCLVTLLTSGSCELPQAGENAVVSTHVCAAVIGPMEQILCDDLFLLGAILEHAPPARS